MSTIIKKQHETAKKLLENAERTYDYYILMESRAKDFDPFYEVALSLFTIVGGVNVYNYGVMLKTNDTGLMLIELCRNRFAAYEQELKKYGLLDLTFEELLEQREDLTAREQPVYTEGQKLEMLYQQEQQERYYFEQ
jgi:hypothetical protein